MHLVYIDESMDHNNTVISALAVDSLLWLDTLNSLKSFRADLKRQYGIYVRREFHARDWVAGRGAVAPTIIPKGLRCHLFDQKLRMLASLPGLTVYSVCAPTKRLDWGFERLANRINRGMADFGSQAILICDQGKEALYTPLLRKMRHVNYIPSKYGGWYGSGSSLNIPTKLIIEDPVFVRSERSLFIQAVDCCAYALLRSEYPIASRSKYQLDQSFDILEPICEKKANPNDHRNLGIVRV